MKNINIDNIRTLLLSSKIEDRSDVITQGLNFITDFNQLILEDFSCNPDIIVAEKLFEYLSKCQVDLLEQYEKETNNESKYFYAIFLYLLNNSIGLPLLLEYANSNDFNKAIFVINKLAAKNNQELIPIIEKKLKSINLDKNVDYLVCLLNAAKELNLTLPKEFLDKVSVNSFFQIKSILKTDFNFLV